MEGRGPADVLHRLLDEEVGAVDRLFDVHVGVHPGRLVLAIADMGLHHAPPSRDLARRLNPRRWGWGKRLREIGLVIGSDGGVESIGVEEGGCIGDHGGGGGGAQWGGDLW